MRNFDDRNIENSINVKNTTDRIIELVNEINAIINDVNTTQEERRIFLTDLINLSRELDVFINRN